MHLADTRALRETMVQHGWNLSSLVMHTEGTSRPEFMSSAQVQRLWESAIDPARMYLMYLAVPYCTEKCAFCQLFKYMLDGRPDTDGYLDHLEAAFEAWAPLFRGITFRRLTIGGGTPSVLSADQMDRLLGSLTHSFSFDDRFSHCVEFTPRTVTDARLEVLRRYGISKISMGVQTTDAAILDNHARYHQGLHTVQRAVDLVRTHGFRECNVDLILGMQGDTDELFRQSFRHIAALRPTSIIVYMLSPQAEYLRTHYAGDVERWRAEFRAKQDAVLSWLPEELAAHGYVFPAIGDARGSSSWQIYLEGDDAAPRGDIDAVYDHTTPAPISLLGLGPDAESRIAGVARYKDTGPRPRAYDPDELRYTAHRIAPGAEMRKAVLMAIHHHSRVKGVDFERWFGRPIDEALPDEIQSLFARGLASREGDDLVFPPDPPSQMEAGLTVMGTDQVLRLSRHVAARSHLLDVRYAGRRLELQLEPVAADRPYIVHEAGWGLIGVGGPDREAVDEGDPRVRVLLKVLHKALERCVKDDIQDPLQLLRALAARCTALGQKVGASVTAEVRQVHQGR